MNTNKTKIKKYIKYEIENIESNKIKIANNDKDIMNFVEESINQKSSNKTIYFGKITDNLANQIYKKTNIYVKNYNLSLKASNIKKILKDHGNDKIESLRGQIAVKKSDFKYIDDIILNNDNFFCSGTTKQGKPSITFEKRIGNKYIIVEYISDKHHNLEVQSMYKKK